jgi:hypothetical protein
MINETEKQELAGLLILENRLVDKFEETCGELKTVRARTNELLRKKRAA